MSKCRVTEESIAGRLRQWRRGTGLDLASFAKSMDMTLSEYNYYERNVITPGAAFLSVLAGRGLDMGWLLTGKAYHACSMLENADNSAFEGVSEPSEEIKELTANIICNAVHSEAEAFVAEFLDAYGLVLTETDEKALTEHACSFFANFGADGSAHKVLWSYLRRRLDEHFPLTGVEFSHE